MRALRAAFLVLLGVLTGLLGAVVFAAGWRWFVVPMGIPAVSFWQAWGLMVFVGMLRFHYDHRESEMTLAQNAVGIVANLFSVLMAWGLMALAHWLMG